MLFILSEPASFYIIKSISSMCGTKARCVSEKMDLSLGAVGWIGFAKELDFRGRSVIMYRPNYD